MGLDASDFIDNMLDEQARVNSMTDDGDVNNLVADVQAINSEQVGMTTEVLATTTYAAPHAWGDGHSIWGFGQWGN